MICSSPEDIFPTIAESAVIQICLETWAVSVVCVVPVPCNLKCDQRNTSASVKVGYTDTDFKLFRLE